jgi:ferrochelatase
MVESAVLLIGFGGPESPEEVRPFLESVLRGVKTAPGRLEEVLRHYEHLGGVSPYNAITLIQKKALEKWLKSKNVGLPVLTGYLHSNPSFDEIFLELEKQKIGNVIAFILSALRCRASFDKYVERLEEAKARVGAANIRIKYTAPFHKNPLFIGAQQARVEEFLKTISPDAAQCCFFIFCAHSIPVEMAEESGYADQLAELAAFVAQELGLRFWDIAYQSRSGDPNRPWLWPDVKDVIRKVNPKIFNRVVLVPAGFLSDNVEVLYDLDVEARREAVSHGLKYGRALTVMDHPLFIEMMGELVIRKWEGHT